MTNQDSQMKDDVPYNPANILLDKSSLSSFLKTYDVSDLPNDISVYRKAFTHKSYITRKNDNFLTGNVNCPESCLPLQEESNERLEYLGDAILGCIVADYLFERYPNENEGFLTKMRTKLVNGKMLAHLSKIVGLPRFLILSKQIEESNGRVNNLNILEDVFEAFIGAIKIDLGYDVVRDWIISVIETNLDFTELIKMNKNYKDIFLKHINQTYGYIPKFFEMSVNTSNNRKIYTYCSKNNEGNIISIGRGSTKKEAENDASYNELVRLGIL